VPEKGSRFSNLIICGKTGLVFKEGHLGQCSYFFVGFHDHMIGIRNWVTQTLSVPGFL